MGEPQLSNFDSNGVIGPDPSGKDGDSLSTVDCWSGGLQTPLSNSPIAPASSSALESPSRANISNHGSPRPNVSKPLVHFAAERGHVRTVQILVNKGRYVDETDTAGRTPLHLAAHHGHVEMVSGLLQLGANVEILDHWGWSAMHYAIQRDCTECLEVLLEHWSM